MEELSRKERAIANFKSGYNCSQSVAMAFSDLVDIDEESLARLSSSFGGGMGRLREVCGAVTGMFMIAGLLYGHVKPSDNNEKMEHYALIQKLAGEFSDRTGSIICRTLKKLQEGPSDPMPEPRTEEYYKAYPCAELVGIAAEILDNEIKSRS